MALTGGNIGFTGYQQPNYAGVVEAAGLPMQAVGQGIAQAQDYFKQQGEKKKLIKQSDIQIDAALKLFPDLAPTLQGVRDQIKDENISLNERADIAESVAGIVNMGTKKMQADAEYGIRKRQLDIEEAQGIRSARIRGDELRAKANEPIKLKPRTITLGPDDALDVLGDDYGNVYDPKSKLRIVDFDGYVEGKPLEETTVSDDSNAFPSPNRYGGDPPINTGGVLPELGQPPSDMDTGGSNYSDGVAVAGTPLSDGAALVGAETPVSQTINELSGPTYTPIPQPRDSVAIQKAVDLTSGGATSGLTPRSRKVGKNAGKEQFRAATLEEAQQRGAAAGQINTETNQFFPINPPPGMTIESDGKGGLKVTQGAGVGGKAEAAKKAGEEAEKQEKQSTNQMFDMAAQTIEQIPNLPDNPIGAKVAEWFGKVVPGTPAGQVAEKLGSMNANIAFSVMRDMRQASPTGAAAGTMTEKEWPLFWQKYGNLSAATNKEDLKNRLQNMTLKMFDAANGTPDERQKAIKDKKITPEQNAKVEEDYLRLRNRMKIPESGISGFSDTQLNVTSEASSLFPADVQSIIDKYTPQPK